jgi:hypothetical protein
MQIVEVTCNIVASLKIFFGRGSTPIEKKRQLQLAQETSEQVFQAVIPAKAGIHFDFGIKSIGSRSIPACAGMTT